MSLTVEKCLQAWTNSLKQLNVKADMVFFGDSLTYYGDFSKFFPDKVVFNLGLRGDTILGMIDRVEQIKTLEPKTVFLMAGINDVATCDIDEFKKRYVNLVKTLYDKLLGGRIVIQNMLPVNDKDFEISCDNQKIIACNDAIRHVSNNYGLLYLDLYSEYAKAGLLEKKNTIDGIHIKPECYQEWINCIIRNEGFL